MKSSQCSGGSVCDVEATLALSDWDPGGVELGLRGGDDSGLGADIALGGAGEERLLIAMGTYYVTGIYHNYAENCDERCFQVPQLQDHGKFQLLGSPLFRLPEWHC
jgi:hypothetical protein